MTAMTNAVGAEAEDQERKRWKRRIIAESEAMPAGAMTWKSKRDKAKLLDTWRVQIGKTFSDSPRVLRVAWALEWLFTDDGYAYATDSFFAQKLDVPLKKIQAAMTELERSGGIVRASVYVRNRLQRRIWPSSKILQSIPPTVGGIHTPHDGSQHTPHGGGTEYLRKKPASQNFRISSVADAARRDAERREEADARKRAASNQ